MNRALARLDRVLFAALFVFGALVPLFFEGYEIKLATTIVIQAGLTSALGLVVGPAGLVSLSHAAFYGLAAYLLALLAPAAAPADLALTFAVCVFGAAAFAAVVGLVSLRARGLYFILMTLAFGQLAFHFFNDTRLAGSSDGVYINLRPVLHLPSFALDFEQPAKFYALAFAIVVAVVAACWWLRRSSFGVLLVATRENETRIRAFGYSPYLLRLAVFVVSGAMAGAMGYLVAAQNGFVAPQMLAWQVSAFALVTVLIGGRDSVCGPVVGVIVLLLAEEFLQRQTEHWLVGVALIIIAVVLAAPQGIVPLLARCWPHKSKQVKHA